MSLTPLADAMFQLLIFFMLTTSLTPYSLITLRSGDRETEEAVEQAEAEAETPPPAPASPSDPLPEEPQLTIWALEEGSVSVGGQRYKPDQLLDLAAAIGSRANPGNVVILVTETARVQDVAGAMAALKAAEVTAVRIVTETEGN